MHLLGLQHPHPAGGDVTAFLGQYMTSLPRGWVQRAEAADGFCADNPKRGLRVIVSDATCDDGKRWRHLSLTRRDRAMPTWEQLVTVKEEFLGPEAVALQVLAPRSEWVNIHPTCLHLWECLDGRVTPDFTAGTGSI